MRISRVAIENFRCVKSAEVSLEDLTCIVGRNGVGKSTLLYALDSFYNVAASYSELDYYNHNSIDNEIRIRVTYDDLRRDELEAFGSYVHDGTLVVTKRINQGGARYYGVSPQIREFADLRRLSAADKRTRLRERMDAGAFPGFPALPRRNEEVDTAMTQYEVQHPELTELVEKETQFLGPKNVGGGTLDKFTRFVLVPAVRDASNELERRGAIMQLLDLLVTRSIASRQDFQEFKEQFEQRARQLYGRENLPELANLGRLVTERLSKYSPGAALSIDFGELKAPAIPLPDAVVVVSEDEFKVPVRYSGHGLQRALILALLEQLSTTVLPVRAQTEQEDAERVEVAQRLPDLILAIEEPELYLHPSRSRYLANILRELARRKREQAPPTTQVVLVTHSPYFVDVAHFDQVRMCRKRRIMEGEAPAAEYSAYPLMLAARRLAQIAGRREEEFTAASFVAHAVPVLNSIVNEGLFAECVLLVEGESDAAALWTMQLLMDNGWDERGIVIIPVSGKSKMDKPAVVFQGFKIPTYILFDGDRAKNEGAASNRMLLALTNEPVVDYPDYFVGAESAAFSEDIEVYLETTLGHRYVGLREECARACGVDHPSRAMKNPDVMSRFITQATSTGEQFAMLRTIVEAVTARMNQGPPANA